MKKILFLLSMLFFVFLQADVPHVEAAEHKLTFDSRGNLIMPDSDPVLAYVCWHHLLMPGSSIVIVYGSQKKSTEKALSLMKAFMERLTYMKPCFCIERNELQVIFDEKIPDIRIRIVVL
jgi:hypothetical protein